MLAGKIAQRPSNEKPHLTAFLMKRHESSVLEGSGGEQEACEDVFLRQRLIFFENFLKCYTWASKLRMYSTVRRVPLMAGFLTMTFG